MLSYLRSVLFTIPLAFSTTAILIWLSYLASLFNRRSIDPIFRFWARAVMWVCGARHSARGVENVDPSRTYVIVSNHLSLIDSPLLVAYLPLTVRFLAKKELFRIPVMGGYMARTGHILIDRSNARAAVASMTEAAKILETGTRSVLIYPEGTRSLDGTMQSFKDGAALLAIKSGLPILPVAVHGTNAVLPSKGVVIRTAPVELHVGRPVETAGLTAKDRVALTSEIEQRVRELADVK